MLHAFAAGIFWGNRRQHIGQHCCHARFIGNAGLSTERLWLVVGGCSAVDAVILSLSKGDERKHHVTLSLSKGDER